MIGERTKQPSDSSEADIIAALRRAVRLLRAGELVAFPTETVYGLGADADNAQAVAKIFAAKQRPTNHPLIVHLAGRQALDAWAREVPQAAYRLAEAFWPGPLTLILKRRRRVIDAVTGGQDTVGLRVPRHPLALELLAQFEGANHAGIAAPSANRHGRISPTTAAHVRAELGDAVSAVLDGGPCAIGIESTIVDFSRGEARVLRPGAIGVADIERVIGASALGTVKTPSAVPRVPGALPGHYAPAAPLRILARDELVPAVKAALAGAGNIAVLARFAAPLTAQGLRWYVAPADAAGYAHHLYSALRALDELGIDLILVEAPPAGVDWTAIADRLRRAAHGSDPAEAT